MADGVGSTGISLGRLNVDPQGGTARLDDRALALSRRQLELLALLVSNRNRVLSRLELSTALGLQGGRSVDVLLSGLRSELGSDFVRNVPKRGWIIIPDALVPGPPTAPVPDAGG